MSDERSYRHWRWVAADLLERAVASMPPLEAASSVDAAMRWAATATDIAREIRLLHLTRSIPDAIHDPARHEELKKRIMEYVSTHPGATKSIIRQAMAVKSSRTDEAIAALIAEGRIPPCMRTGRPRKAKAKAKEEMDG